MISLPAGFSNYKGHKTKRNKREWADFGVNVLNMR